VLPEVLDEIDGLDDNAKKLIYKHLETYWDV
jgi:hypothetical protein